VKIELSKKMAMTACYSSVSKVFLEEDRVGELWTGVGTREIILWCPQMISVVQSYNLEAHNSQK